MRQVDLEQEPSVPQSTHEMVSAFNAMDDFERELQEVTRAAGGGV